MLWLRAGTNQLHLFAGRRDARRRAPTSSFDVDDFDAVYAKAKELGILDTRAFGSPLRTHPAGWVQLYLRDPAGNLSRSTGPTRARSRPRRWPTREELGGQDGDAATATLYHRVTAFESGKAAC